VVRVRMIIQAGCEKVVSQNYGRKQGNRVQFVPLTKACITVLLKTFKYRLEKYLKYKNKAIYL
jgi:hypothetical protein